MEVVLALRCDLCSAVGGQLGWAVQPSVVQWWRLCNTGKPREVMQCLAVAGQDLVGYGAV